MTTPPAEPSLAFVATTTMRDILAAEAILRPARKGRTAGWRRPAIVVGCAVIGLAAGVLSGSGDQTDVIKTFFTTLLGVQSAAMLAVLFGALWIAGRARRGLNKVLVRAAHAESRRSYPGVDRRDPNLPIERHYRFDEGGMTTSAAYDEIWESWRRITALDETPELLVVRVGTMVLSTAEKPDVGGAAGAVDPIGSSELQLEMAFLSPTL